MATAELTQGFTTAAEAELSELARSLSVLAGIAMDYPNALKQVSRGFTELSTLARACGKARIFMTSRALASVIERLDRAPEGDAPFILDTVINFLDNLHATRSWSASGVKA
ncbi:MAG: hypothetical protein JWO30_410 [Fibrobacteres bacterium]|nr:hypothetical protein [Fibrobacterota bacterium]